ncbi:hypothetical protein CRENBAI_023145 [Crenichthys baileyi]|uniref:Uncharacterized protein n=1 Tax=Crenichthys baileyi TaxID=28760 RepID=A0AAV9SGP7_9TELE
MCVSCHLLLLQGGLAGGLLLLQQLMKPNQEKHKEEQIQLSTSNQPNTRSCPTLVSPPTLTWCLGYASITTALAGLCPPRESLCGFDPQRSTQRSVRSKPPPSLTLPCLSLGQDSITPSGTRVKLLAGPWIHRLGYSSPRWPLSPRVTLNMLPSPLWSLRQ